MRAIGDPGRLGFDASRLEQIDVWLNRYVEEKKYAGSSVLVARHGEIAHLSAVGQRSIENNLPFETDTLARIYSMTKPLTSLAVMMLHEKGLFHLNAPIDDFLPEFSNCRALIEGAVSTEQYTSAPAPTIHQLLTHTSGLTYSFNPGLLAQEYLRSKIDFEPMSGGLSQMVKRAAEMPLAFQPGAHWEYSIGIDILGRFIEVVTGKSLDVFFREEITGPLGMDNTAFSVSAENQDIFASSYTPIPGNSLRLVDDSANSRFGENKVSTLSGGGGLVSTLSDYFKFVELLRLGGAANGVRLVSPRTMNFMRRNHLKGDIASMGPKSFAEMPMEGMGFGIGGSVVLDPAHTKTMGSVGDFSWGGMASTLFWIDPIEQLSVVFFTQLLPSSTYPSRAELKALVHAALVN